MASSRNNNLTHNCFWFRRGCAGRTEGIVAVAGTMMLALLVVAATIFGAPPSFASPSETIQRLLPSVVRITVHTLTGNAEDPAGESYGSGFIVDPNGYIVTNQHVVEGAYEIIVTLSDGMLRHAKLVGTGGDVDIALLKIETHHILEPVVLADSNETKIGEEVFAIGNPYGIGITVTRGIISAINRDLNRSAFDAYLQTDAAINRGNSGGPLINGAGQVIGISTAYYRGAIEKGGSIGLGFAIPSAVARTMIDLIRQYGYPKVGWIGVDGQTLTADMASALGLDHKTGAILASIRKDGPSIGLLQPDDIILEVEGEKLLDMRMLQRAAIRSIGLPIRLKVLRRNIERQVIVTPTERPASRANPSASSLDPKSVNGEKFGLSLLPLDENRRARLNLPSDAVGVYIGNVAAISAASEAGLVAGDIIESVQLGAVRTGAEVTDALAVLKNKGRDFALLRVRSRDQTRFVTLHLIWQGPEHDPNN